jgi:hypothetical protein
MVARRAGLLLRQISSTILPLSVIPCNGYLQIKGSIIAQPANPSQHKPSNPAEKKAFASAGNQPGFDHQIIDLQAERG